jgi:Reverse transcriptase (RNA-dependent DNA polymerase).
MSHADDVVIKGRKLQEVEEVFTSLVEKTNEVGLKINEKNTKFTIVSQKSYNEN